MDKIVGKFIWDESKEKANIKKHGIGFDVALRVFLDPRRQIYVDSKHSE
ncbi:MAG: BrnT family toxin [Candidatus Omnitrophota bacterium]